jgi:hypothetical protein
MDNFSEQFNGYFQGRVQSNSNQRRAYNNSEYPARQQPAQEQSRTLPMTPATEAQPSSPSVLPPSQNASPSSVLQYRQSISSGDSPQYMNQFLSTQIGKKIKAEFLIGTGMLVDKTGILVDVGANYIIINETATDDYVACDYYSLKFVTIYY